MAGKAAIHDEDTSLERALVDRMLEDLESQAKRFEAKALDARALMTQLRKVYELEVAPASTNGAGDGKVKRAAAAAGSLEDRILGALRAAPIGIADLVKQVKARKPDVKRAMAELIEAGRVKRTGVGPGTKYAVS